VSRALKPYVDKKLGSIHHVKDFHLAIDHRPLVMKFRFPTAETAATN
jgi:hypothetical protein